MGEGRDFPARIRETEIDAMWAFSSVGVPLSAPAILRGRAGRSPRVSMRDLMDTNGARSVNFPRAAMPRVTVKEPLLIHLIAYLIFFGRKKKWNPLSDKH